MVLAPKDFVAVDESSSVMLSVPNQVIPVTSQMFADLGVKDEGEGYSMIEQTETENNYAKVDA